MPQFLAPIINDQQEDANGAPLSGGRIEVYLAGSSTAATTYSDKAGLVANTWPIVLNTLGVSSQGAIWLTGGTSYKFVIKNIAGVLQRTIDNVSGINDASAVVDQWIVSQSVPIYVSPTSFTLAGDQTQIFHVGRRVKTANTGGFVYSTIIASVYSSPNTTITLSNDSGALDTGLSQVSYGVISAVDTSGPTIPGMANTGDFKFIMRASAPAGWIAGIGQTMGNTGSGATLTGTSFQALFYAWWTDYSDAQLPILTSAGSASTRGASAAADWAANKRLTVFDVRDRVPRNAGGVQANGTKLAATSLMIPYTNGPGTTGVMATGADGSANFDSAFVSSIVYSTWTVTLNASAGISFGSVRVASIGMLGCFKL